MSSTTTKVLKWAARKAIKAAVSTAVGPVAVDNRTGEVLTCIAEPRKRGKRCGKTIRNSGGRGRGGKTDDLTCGSTDCATWYAMAHMGL